MESHSDLYLDRPDGQLHLTAVLTLSLTADFRGGCFVYSKDGSRVEHIGGRLLMWSSVYPNGLPRAGALHHIEPVYSGRRFALGLSYDFAGIRYPDVGRVYYTDADIAAAAEEAAAD
eukprot:TRINITY_DN5462_c2_g1_i2.p2 TRINITY_DN5462_c2_g1~~TRINITY_DN5462_c2_g1_i2.p2  ORF type:complete len:117 (+),score=40.29 TRINITY_DN5462_c2_g1_i2:550-900(+)